MRRTLRIALAGLGLLENSPYGAAARRARAKVLAISREDQRAPVDEALASMFVIDAQSPSEAAISLIPEAIAARRVVRLHYTSVDGETHTTRDVEAMGLLRGGDSWMFVGWCRLREGIRGFHLGRIRHLEITGEVFPNAILRCSTQICRAGALGGSGDATERQPRACRGAPTFDETDAKSAANRNGENRWTAERGRPVAGLGLGDYSSDAICSGLLVTRHTRFRRIALCWCRRGPPSRGAAVLKPPARSSGSLVDPNLLTASVNCK